MKSFLLKKTEVDKFLSVAPVIGKRMLFKTDSAPLGILEDHMVSNDAEVHKNEGDLWYCLEGEVLFICGGELIEPRFGTNKDGSENQNELKAKGISGGSEMALKAGDWLWIAPGEPHQHKCDKTARLAIIKVPKT